MKSHEDRIKKLIVKAEYLVENSAGVVGNNAIFVKDETQQFITSWELLQKR